MITLNFLKNYLALFDLVVGQKNPAIGGVPFITFGRFPYPLDVSVGKICLAKRLWRFSYIIPPIPPMSGIGGAAGESSTTSVTIHSVVIIKPATEAAA